jgi:hypothetical protein
MIVEEVPCGMFGHPLGAGGAHEANWDGDKPD